MKDQIEQKIKEMVNNLRREDDGLLDIGKYDERYLESILFEAISFGQQLKSEEWRKRIENIYSDHGMMSKELVLQALSENT